MSLLDKNTLKELMDVAPKEKGGILAVYLNTDTLDPVNAKGGFKVVFEGLLDDAMENLPDKQRPFLEECVEKAKKRVEHLIPKGKSLVMFISSDGRLDVFEELPVKITSQVVFKPTPYIRPLLELIEKAEAYCIVLLSREKVRFLRYYLGQLEEMEERSFEPPVKHRQTSGTDHMRSQMVLQRRAASWSNRFLKEVSERLLELIHDRKMDYIILGGTEEVLAEFKRLLPKHLQERILESVRISVNARHNEILDTISPLIKERELAVEKALVEDLLEAAEKGGEAKAILGINQTLNAVNEGRVYLFVYPEGKKIKGYKCDMCEVVLDHIPRDNKCPYCEEPCNETGDVIWEAAEKVISMGGKTMEIVSKAAKDALNSSGIVGAFLR